MTVHLMTSSASMRRHYLVERELAHRLRNATSEERKHLYTAVYNELFERVPDHPQNVMKRNATAQAAETARQLGLIKRFLRADTNYMEIGPGDCALAVAVSERVARVYAMDVSDGIAACARTPANFQLIISDGTSVPVQQESVDIVYSNQLMEHLHEDDATLQLVNIFKALRRGGAYVCVTPNRLCGPHDVSAHFDTEPTGLHLKEYSNDDLVRMFQDDGFRKCKALLSYKQFVLPPLLPIWPFVLVERILQLMPRGLARTFAKFLIGVKLVAVK
jgi:2-polyprenyl-3-methyl-5-hydroxy-6-metoxy-1,4-benzoquinol methylase